MQPLGTKLRPTCAHIYPNEEGRSCPYPRFFSELSEKDPSVAELPADSKGMCLFHSTEEDWKVAQGFLDRFVELKRHLDRSLTVFPATTHQQDRYDFRGFVFCRRPTQSVIDLASLEFFHKADFVASRFLHHVEFEGCRFKDSAYFENAHFHGYAHFVSCHFQASAYFTDAEFDNFAVFRDAIFSGTAAFVGTLFSRTAATFFDNVVIEKSLTFKGTPRTKMFRNSISLSVCGGKGVISFENADFTHLDGPSKAHIQNLEASGNAIVGPGCQKHRFSKEIILPYRQRHKVLLQEIAQAFVEFFNFDGLLQATLCVEVEYQEDTATIRYFSDCDLSRGEIERLLAASVPHFLRFLKDPDQCLKSPISIEQWDVYRRLKLTQLGLAARAALGQDWNFEDTLNALSVCPGPIGNELGVNLHQHFETTQISAGGDLQLVFKGRGEDNAKNISQTMGDTFKGISHSTIVNRSNVVSQTCLSEIRQCLQEIRKEVEEKCVVSSDLDKMSEALKAETVDKVTARKLWEKVVKLAPDVKSVAEAAEKISDLLR